MVEDFFDLAVFAFAQAQSQPDIVALLALQMRLNRPVMNAFNRDPVLQRIEIGLGDRAIGADAIAAQPAGFRQSNHPRQPAVIGQQQQAFGVDIKPPDGHNPWQACGQGRKDRGSAFGIPCRCHKP
jgi:hypothetical protein